MHFRNAQYPKRKLRHIRTCTIHGVLRQEGSSRRDNVGINATKGGGSSAQFFFKISSL